jgi:hypothetical protein
MDAAGWIEAMLSRMVEAEEPAPAGLGSTIEFSPTLGRRIRRDATWADAAVSTYARAREAIEAGDRERAAAYVDFFVDEAAVIYGVLRGLIPDAITFLEGRGMLREEIAALNRRLLDLIRLPDGRPFNARLRWAEFRSQVRACLVACGAGDRETALARLAQLKETWRQIQDRDVHHLYGLIDAAARRWGEEAVGEFWEAIIGPLFRSRYEKFDVRVSPWSESLWTNVYLAFESMRGHLVGPAREGDIEFSEDQERYTWRFDPCGSGGRSMRGDAVEGSPPRMESPFGYGVTQEEHDWAWNRKGVCYYCAHCCVVMQLKPIDAFGYPVRVVEPPTYPEQREAKCTWHVYKDPASVPERFYTEVGRTKPPSLPRAADSAG